MLCRNKLKLCTYCTILAAHIYKSFCTNLRHYCDTFYCILSSTSSTQRSTENIQRIKITFVSFCKSASMFITWILRRTFFSVTKPTRCTNFTNLFCHETLHVSDSSPVHMLLLESCLQTCMTYTIAECTVNKLLMMDR